MLLDWLADRPPSRVLDAGCFDGMFAHLARQQGHHVTGLDRHKHEGVAERLDVFVEADLNDPLPVLEARTTSSSRATSSSTSSSRTCFSATWRASWARAASCLISVPNFGHWYPRGRIALGRFDYDQRGPLDRGHIRFFTRNTIEALIESCGLHVRERRTVGTPFDTLAGPQGSRARAVRAATRTDEVMTRVWPRMFGYQFLYRVTRD